MEDAGAGYQALFGIVRYLNHFHNPLKDWPSAGLSDVASGESLLEWAQDSANQTAMLGGDWSWQTVRDYYYTALTSKSDATRQEYFAQTFRGVGHQMHLVQDVSVPAHVRNDSHAQDAMGWKQSGNLSLRLETWAKGKPRDISLYANAFAATPGAYSPAVSLNVPISGKAPITQLVDADIYTGANPTASLAQGLAEYTNKNFASEYTIFAESKPANDPHYFPYPRKSSTNLQDYVNQSKLPEVVIAKDNVQDTSFWIAKTGDGETYDHFARPTYLTDNLQSLDDGANYLFYRSFYLDEACHKDYVEKLIPRAVGYSAALLDYFFRGKIELSLPPAGVYGTSPADGSFTELRVNAKNVTADEEKMTDGSIELVLKYKVALSDPFQGIPVEVDPEPKYLVVPEKTGKKTIPSDTTTELVFNLSTTSLPIWATDVAMWVVYKGKLGNEEKSVAVGYKDIPEPTPVDVYNNTGYTCVSGQWYESGSDELFHIKYTPDLFLYRIRDMYPHNIATIAFWVKSPDNTVLTSAPALAPNDMRRLGYILTDSSFTYGFSKDWVHTDPYDYWTNLYLPVSPHPGTAVVNANGSYPKMYIMQDKAMWWGTSVIFDNVGYWVGWEGAIDTSCSWDDLP